MLIALNTLKGKSIEEHIKTIQAVIAQKPNFAEEVRSVFEEKIKTSTLMLKESAANHQFAVIALVCIILADITTIPDQLARKPYLKTIDELCSYYGISPFDISVFSRYSSLLEELISGEN